MQEHFGAIKIKDGLFLGDIYSAQDLEFVVNNKVSHIINCASKQIPNHWEPIGLKYLSFDWTESRSQVILDAADLNFSLFFPFIEETLHSGSSVLVHCVKAAGRSAVVVIAYLMKRFGWNLFKTLQFLSFRKVNIDLQANFLLQVKMFELKLIKTRIVFKSNDWISRKSDPEEELLINTFVKTANCNKKVENLSEKITFGKKISWADEKNEEKSSPKSLPLIKSCLKSSKSSDFQEKFQRPAYEPAFNFEYIKKKKKVKKMPEIQVKSSLFQ
jgi:protein-tyrosine phosphatase